MKKTVLIVEDDRWLADSFCLCLERASYKVVVEYNAQDAISAIDDRKIDVVLLDIFLPGANGVQFLQELRSYADTAKTPVIICTTAAKQLPREVAEQYGVLCVLDKTTLTPAALRQAVTEVAMV
jgi:DNA-binding response OmpR family regulator